MSRPVQDPKESPQWRSYLMPGTDVLRTVAELIDPTAVTIFERIVSADAEAALRQDTDRPTTFDLAHLNDIHERLFADVYPFAGALRYVDTAKPGHSGAPFVHHRWIDTYASAVTQQLRLEDNLATRTDPGQWADRAAYYWAAMLHAHPYRAGNGRSIRVWIEDLAHHAGHELDWTRSSAERNLHVAVAAANGDLGDRYHEALALFGMAASCARSGAEHDGDGFATDALRIFTELGAEEADVARAFLARSAERTEVCGDSHDS